MKNVKIEVFESENRLTKSLFFVILFESREFMGQLKDRTRLIPLLMLK